MSSAPIASLLVVDDQPAQLQSLCDILRDQDYGVTGFTSAAEALAALETQSFDLLLTDLSMPEMDGVELLEQALQLDPQLVGILITGKGTIETAVSAMKSGALDYVLKPVRLHALLPVLSRALDIRRLRLENAQLRDTVAIQELNQVIAHTLEPGALLDKIVDATIAQTGADEVSIMLLDHESRMLRVAAARGPRRDTLLGTRLPLGEGIAGRVATDREPVLVQGLPGDTDMKPLFPRPDIRASLCIPMINRDRMVGVLNASSMRDTRAFTRGQVKVLSLFTNAAAASIEAARLHEAQRRTDARYREVLHMAAEGIITIDHEQRIVIFNSGAEKIFGYQADEVTGKPVHMLLPAELAERHREHVAGFAAGPDGAREMGGHGRIFGRRKDGNLINVEIGISRRLENGSPLCTAVVRDITQRILHEERIARLTRLYAVLSAVNTTIVRILDRGILYSEICRVVKDTGGFMAAVIAHLDDSATACRVLASSGADVQGTLFRAGPLIRKAIDTRDLSWDNELDENFDSGLRSVVSIEPYARAAAVLPFELHDKVVAVMLVYAEDRGAFHDEELRLLREMAGDVSFALDHIDKSSRLEYMATHDQLTGMPNRAVFMDRLGQALDTARAHPDHVAVILLDIARFRHFNNTFGRHEGDRVLRQVGRRLRAQLVHGASLARISADVFALVYTGIHNANAVHRRLFRHMDAIRSKPFVVQGNPMTVTTHAGIAMYPEDGDDADVLFRNAEAALRRGKTQHEAITFYTRDINARVSEQVVLESRLHRALKRGEFVLHYQPKVDFASGAIVGLEGLLRWQDPESGLVPPDRFIPLLEETGLIVEAGNWVLRQAIAAAARLRSLGHPEIRIAVNVSPVQLRKPDFVTLVERLLATTAAANHGLDLEITESVIMNDLNASVRTLTELRALGIEVAIDDFGTGYSSLAYIARLPVKVVKIDRSFVRNLGIDDTSRSIVSSTISLAHSLDRIVVAEGVETEEQAQLLRELGCDCYQGYLFCRPVPLSEIEARLATTTRR